MKFRYIKQSDLKEIRRINSHPDHCYDLETPEFVLGGVVVDDDDKVIGFGGVKILYEPILILDFNRSKRTRVNAARLLLVNGIRHSVARGIKCWYAFCEKEFAAFVVKWFDFVPAERSALLLDLEGGRCVTQKREGNAEETRGGPCIGEEQVWGLRRGTETRESSSG